MRTTITVRTDSTLRRALAQRARVLGVGVSELVRSILEDALRPRPLGARTGHLRGVLALPRTSGDVLRVRIRRQNWRP